MYCQKCGKEISDQASFCNFCGAAVYAAQPAAPRQPVQQQSVQQRQQTNTTGKRGWGMRILGAVIAVAVFFLVKTAVSNTLTGSDDKPVADPSYNTPTIAVKDNGLRDAVSGCVNGALYHNGELRYGFARLTLPDYYDLLPGTEGQGDYLVSSDGHSLVSVSRQLEIMDVSYNATTEAGILQSSLSAYPDAAMVDFQKYQKDGAYVIRYIFRGTDSGVEMYFGELILMPSETCSETIRLCMFQTAETGYDRINQAFDTLSISPDYAPDSSETNQFGHDRIAVK